MRRPPATLAVAGIAVVGLMVLPLAHLALRAADADQPLALLGSERVIGFALSTLRLGVTVTVLALAIGLGLAWLLERTDLPARRLMGVLAALPLAVPTYVAALALLAAFGPRGALAELSWVTGFWGATLALTLSTFPYVLLPVRASLARLDPAVEDAARALGDSTLRAFLRTVLPQLRPAVGAGGVLVFLYVLSDFGAVSILRYDTLTRGIFLEYRSSFDRAPAAVLGLLLVAVAVAAVGVERVWRGSRHASQAVAGTRPASLVSLGRWRWPAAGAVVAVAMAGVGVPVAVLIRWAVEGTSDGAAGAVLARTAATSASISGAAAVVAVMAAAPVAVLAVRFRSAFSRTVETVAVAGYALPGLVVGLAFVFFAARFVPVIYQTVTLVVLAYVVRFLPEALGALRSSLSLVDPALEDAARSLGRTRLQAALTVTMPLVRPGAVAGAALVFLTSMKELPATLLLRPAGVDTLAVRVWTGASEGFYAQAAPAALMLVAVSALALLPIRQAGGR